MLELTVPMSSEIPFNEVFTEYCKKVIEVGISDQQNKNPSFFSLDNHDGNGYGPSKDHMNWKHDFMDLLVEQYENIENTMPQFVAYVKKHRTFDNYNEILAMLNELLNRVKFNYTVGYNFYWISKNTIDMIRSFKFG